jgi:hypothetical protein
MVGDQRLTLSSWVQVEGHRRGTVYCQPLVGVDSSLAWYANEEREAKILLRNLEVV